MKDEPKNYTSVPVGPVIVEVSTVAKTIEAVYRNPRQAIAKMTVHELKALADAARATIQAVEITAKPNGITDEGRINALLEIDVARLNAEVDRLVDRLQEHTAALEKKIADREKER